jgi:Lrp/AsnC family leucine-responsive transcriptional regulator
MAFDLDELDRKILDVLLKDARTPASQVADQIGLSRPAVAERIAGLERAGVLRGTTAVVDPGAYGRQVTAFVSARGAVALGTKARGAFNELLAGDEVLEAHTVAGDDCYLLKVRTDTIASLNSLVSRLTAPPLSLSTRTTIVMETFCEKVGGIDLGERK